MAMKEYVGATALARFLSKLTAKFVGYDNSSSDLEATNVQDAVDELNSNLTKFINPNDTIVSWTETSVSTTGFVYTATQDCYINGEIDASSTSLIPYLCINSVGSWDRVFSGMSGAKCGFGIYLKAGQTLYCRPSGSGYTFGCNFKVCGLI